jgi:hypothetical protein
MTQEAFIKELDKQGYSYEIEGDRIIVTNKRYVNLDALTSLPLGVEFRNEGNVILTSLTSLPPGIEFKNNGEIILTSLTSIPPGVEFKNEWAVYLKSLIGGYSNECEFLKSIKGIRSKRLLNMMIKQGLFER